jgi:hypothetical protein
MSKSLNVWECAGRVPEIIGEEREFEKKSKKQSKGRNPGQQEVKNLVNVAQTSESQL